jgi:hypothetical protein
LNTKFSNDKSVGEALCSDYKEGKGEEKEDKEERMKKKEEIKRGGGRVWRKVAMVAMVGT